MKKTDNPSKPQKVWYESFSFETDGIMIVLSDKKLIQKAFDEAEHGTMYGIRKNGKKDQLATK